MSLLQTPLFLKTDSVNLKYSKLRLFDTWLSGRKLQIILTLTLALKSAILDRFQMLVDFSFLISDLKINSNYFQGFFCSNFDVRHVSHKIWVRLV